MLVMRKVALLHLVVARPLRKVTMSKYVILSFSFETSQVKFGDTWYKGLITKGRPIMKDAFVHFDDDGQEPNWFPFDEMCIARHDSLYVFSNYE